MEDLEEAQNVMSYYEWSIADNDVSGSLLHKWAPLYNIDALNQTYVCITYIGQSFFLSDKGKSCMQEHIH